MAEIGSSQVAPSAVPDKVLRRELGLFGAVMMGLGSILGTGVFVSIGIAAGIAGPAVVWAIAIAALVATCNALSSAQLAANHPVSGGTYEYGYRYLRPWLGFTAGWMFLCAKAASAATAALGFAGYLLFLVGHDDPILARPLIAAATVIVLTGFVLGGMRRSNLLNTLIVSVTLLSLVAFILAGLPAALRRSPDWVDGFLTFRSIAVAPLLEACSLMFVAYTGYGRIATLGEEVRDPQRTIPRAIIITIIASALLYVSVGIVLIGSADDIMIWFGNAYVAPLEAAATAFNVPGLPTFVGVGAMTAMLGVLLNLILGLSRVLLAMGRRADMPRATARLNEAGTTPTVAVILVGAAVAGLSLLGSVKTTWSFSAFTVLVYYAITNLAALRLSLAQRLYSPVFAWLGLAACLFLAFWVDWQVWLTGLGLIGVGILWHAIAQRGVRCRGGADRLRSC